MSFSWTSLGRSFHKMSYVKSLNLRVTLVRSFPPFPIQVVHLLVENQLSFPSADRGGSFSSPPNQYYFAHPPTPLWLVFIHERGPFFLCHGVQPPNSAPLQGLRC